MAAQSNNSTETARAHAQGRPVCEVMTDDSETGYQHRSLDAFEVNPEKPGQRWELSPELGIDAYSFNVAVLDPGERPSQSAYRDHENQAEFFYLIEGGNSAWRTGRSTSSRTRSCCSRRASHTATQPIRQSREGHRHRSPTGRKTSRNAGPALRRTARRALVVTRSRRRPASNAESGAFRARGGPPPESRTGA